MCCMIVVISNADVLAEEKSRQVESLTVIISLLSVVVS